MLRGDWPDDGQVWIRHGPPICSTDMYSECNVLLSCFRAGFQEAGLADCSLIDSPVDEEYDKHWEVEGAGDREQDIAQLFVDAALVGIFAGGTFPAQERSDTDGEREGPYEHHQD